MGLTRQQGVSSVNAGAEAGSAAAAAAQQGKNQDAAERLKAYLSGQQGDKNLANAQQYMDDNAAKGRKVSVALGADGNVNLSQNEPNMYAQMQRQQMQNSKAEQQAYQQAANTYQHGIASNATSVQALHSMLGALQSNDPSSMGQLRTAMVLANGFKRYNDNEGTALTPDDKEADVSKLLGKFGLSNTDTSLSDVTRSNVVRFANNKLDDLQDAHNALKSQAQNMYSNSQFADPNKAANLGTTLGAPVDQQLQQMKQKFDQFHAQAVPQSPAQGTNAPSSGLSGFFSKLMGTGQPAQQGPQQVKAAPVGPPAAPGAPGPSAPAPFDPNAFLKGQ